MNSKSRITAIGTYVPDQVLSNNDLAKMVHTNDEWIVQTEMRSTWSRNWKTFLTVIKC